MSQSHVSNACALIPEFTDATIVRFCETVQTLSEPTPASRKCEINSKHIKKLSSSYLGALLYKRPYFLPRALIVEVNVKSVPQKGNLGLGKRLVAVTTARQCH